MDDLPAVTPKSQANSIGFLRLGLASMVVLTHAWLLGGFGREPLLRWSGGTVYCGKIAVQGFFVLSGALVAASYVRVRSPLRFLWHRALRLLPAYWTCLLVTAFGLCLLVFDATGAPGNYLGASPSPWHYVMSNLLRPRGAIGIGGLFAHNPWGTEINGSLWTLYYEGFCYLALAALGAAGLLGRGRRVFLAGYGGLGLVWLLWAGAHPAWLPAACGELFNTEGKILVLFFLSGVAWTAGANHTARWNRQPWLAMVGAVLLAAAVPLHFYPLVAPFALAPVLFWLGDHLPFRGLETRLGGDYSYGIYVYAYPVQQTLVSFGAHRSGLAVFSAISLLAAAALAFGSWHAVEKNFLKLKSLGWPARIPPSAVHNS